MAAAAVRALKRPAAAAVSAASGCARAVAAGGTTLSEETSGKRARNAAQSDAIPSFRDGVAFGDVQTFFFKKEHLRPLSNFPSLPVTIDGRSYATAEHCFQAHKYLHAAEVSEAPKRGEELRTYAARFVLGASGGIGAEGLAAKRAGGKRGLALNDSELKGWTEAAEALQLQICRAKVAAAASPEAREALLSTKDAYLLHQENRAKPSTPWGGRIPDLKRKLAAGESVLPTEVIGQNRLGHIWMKVRDELTADH